MSNNQCIIRAEHYWLRPLYFAFFSNNEPRPLFLPLRSRRDEKTPAWKRLKILDGLISYRASVQERSVEFLLPLEHRLDRFSRNPFSKPKLKQCRGAS